MRKLGVELRRRTLTCLLATVLTAGATECGGCGTMPKEEAGFRQRHGDGQELNPAAEMAVGILLRPISVPVLAYHLR